MPPHGNAGLRLGAVGPAVTITYMQKSDGRLDFDKLGWKNFIEGSHREGPENVYPSLGRANPTLDPCGSTNPAVPIVVTLGPSVPDNNVCIQLAGKITTIIIIIKQ